MKQWLISAGLVAALATPATGAWAAAPAPTIPKEIVVVSGTTHAFVADEQGVLHYVGDTRALAGRPVDWVDRTEMTPDGIKARERGDPWLSASLLKLGDAIYLAKWESGERAPRLLQIQSIEDLEFFGVDSHNYAALVLDRGEWEHRYGFDVDDLQRDALPQAIVTAPAPAASEAAPAEERNDRDAASTPSGNDAGIDRSEEHTSELQSPY